MVTAAVACGINGLRPRPDATQAIASVGSPHDPAAWRRRRGRRAGRGARVLPLLDALDALFDASQGAILMAPATGCQWTV